MWGMKEQRHGGSLAKSTFDVGVIVAASPKILFSIISLKYHHPKWHKIVFALNGTIGILPVTKVVQVQETVTKYSSWSFAIYLKGRILFHVILLTFVSVLHDKSNFASKFRRILHLFVCCGSVLIGSHAHVGLFWAKIIQIMYFYVGLDHHYYLSIYTKY